MVDHGHHGSAIRDEARVLGRELRRAIPEVYRGYAALHDAALAAGSLDGKTKELIALAIAVTRECDGCIASHAHGAAEKGATESEVAETLGVAILMNGGPAPSTVPGRWRRSASSSRTAISTPSRRRPRRAADPRARLWCSAGGVVVVDEHDVVSARSTRPTAERVLGRS